jgi:hypothetical protein
MPLNPLSYTAVLIDESALKAQSIINTNVDMKMLTPTIKLVQDKYLLRLLGTGELVDLQNKVTNQTAIAASQPPPIQYPDGSYPVLNANDKFLLDAYITPLLIYGVMKEAPYEITYKFMNKGVSKMSSETSQTVSLEEVKTLVDRASNNFDWYSQRIIFYLNANTGLYPQYLQVKTMDDVSPTSRGYKSKMYIGNGREGTGACDPEIYYR